MQNKQRYITAGVTIAAAAVTAHLMQRDTGSGPGQPIGPATAAVVPQLPGALTPAPVQNEVTLVAISPEAAPVAPDAATAAAEPPVVAEMPRVEDVQLPDLALEEAVEPVQPMQVALADPMAEDSRPVETGVEFRADFPTPPADVLEPDPMPQTGTDLAERMAEASSATPEITAQPERNEFGLTCGPILSASPVVDGLINVILTAPCRGDERITVHHSDLTFTDQVDPMGTYQITVPAMTSPAVFTIDFTDGEGVETEVDVDGLTALERVALVSEQNSGLQIHALEFGADYGEEGHVWAETPGNPALGALDGNGYLIRLGNEALEAALITEVYTFPRSGSAESGTVRLSVEAEVTLANCATDVTGVTIEPSEAGDAVARNLEVAMPDCDAVGEFLVLKNLLRDLRIASN